MAPSTDIDTLIRDVDRERKRPGSFYLLPDLHAALVAMSKTPRSETDLRSRQAQAVGRVVIEDLVFAESELGTRLLAFCDEYERPPGP